MLVKGGPGLRINASAKLCLAEVLGTLQVVILHISKGIFVNEKFCILFQF